MTWIMIEPMDVWMFRDGRPFSAGEGHTANSLFPPTPFTVQGALRAHISRSLGVSLREYQRGEGNASEAYRRIGEPPGRNAPGLQTGAFWMRGPFLSKWDGDNVERYFPVPVDANVDKENPTTIHRLVPTEDQSILTDLPFIPLATEKGREGLVGGWFTEDSFQKYLNGEPLEKEADCVRSEKLYHTEYRFGVGINEETNYRREGMLYNAAFVRPADGVGLLVEVNDEVMVDVPDGMIPFGGEGRMAKITKVSYESKPEEPKSLNNSNQFKLVFTTPAYFSGGWEPVGGWETAFPQLELVSVALAGSTSIGGWDVTNRFPRSIDRYVPPGSVYYFRTKKDKAFEEFGTALTESNSVMAEGYHLNDIGFGAYALGNW